MRRLFALLILLAAPSWAVVYYVKNGGSDAASGLSDELAWETIAKVNGSSFSPGDSILFKKGSTWREQLTVPSSGSSGNPITFGAYGSGAAPILLGSINKDVAGDWTQEAGTVEYFGDTFETNDFSKWTTETDPNGQLATSTTQKYAGTYSARWNMATTSVATELRKTLADAQSSFTLSFWIYFNDTIDDDESPYLWQGENAATDWSYNVQFRYTGGNHVVSIKVATDSGGSSTTSQYTVQAGASPAWHQVEMVFVASSAPGANDGTAELKIDGVSKQTLSSIDNDVRGAVKYHKIGFYYQNVDRYVDDYQILTGSGDTDLWYAGYSTAPNVVWRNGTRMTKVANKVDLDSYTEWWDDTVNSRVYVYSDGDTNPVSQGGTNTFELATRNYAVAATDKGYCTVDSLDLRYVNADLIRLTRSSSTLPGWTVSNCNLTGCYGKLLYTVGSADNQFDNLSFYENSGADWGGSASDNVDGVYISYGDAFSLHDNEFVYSDTAGNNYGGAIHISHTTASDTECEVYANSVTGTNSNSNAAALQIEDCYYVDVYKNNFAGDYSYGVWSDESGSGTLDGSFYCTFRHNYIALGSGGDRGLFLEVTYHDSVFGNVVDMRGTAGESWALFLGAGPVAGDASTAVYNNTLVVAGGSGVAQFGWTGYSYYLKNCLIKNNIFAVLGDGGACISVQKLDASENGHVFDYNLYYSSGTPAYLIGWFGSFYASAAALHAAHATEETNGQTANPLFTNPAAGDFTLQAGSPCIDAGTDLTSTYQTALMPAAFWPASVLTGSQYNAGQKWECGAYLFPNKRQSLIIVGK